GAGRGGRRAGPRRAGGVPPPPPPRVGLKLIAQAGRERDAAGWIRAAGGFVLSTGPQVLLAELPPDALPRLQACPGIRRAEAPRRLLPRPDEARRAAARRGVAGAA